MRFVISVNLGKFHLAIFDRDPPPPLEVDQFHVAPAPAAGPNHVQSGAELIRCRFAAKRCKYIIIILFSARV